MLGKSRFNHRLHRIAHLFLTLLRLLGETWKELNEQSISILDSFPIAACDNYPSITANGINAMGGAVIAGF